MSSRAFPPFNAPAVPVVKHDRRLVRRYLLQLALRLNTGSLLFLSLAIALMPLWQNFGTAAPGTSAAHKLNPYIISGVVLAVVAWLTLMSSGIARNFLVRLTDEGRTLCAESMAFAVTRHIDASFNSYASCYRWPYRGNALGYS